MNVTVIILINKNKQTIDRRIIYFHSSATFVIQTFCKMVIVTHVIKKVIQVFFVYLCIKYIRLLSILYILVFCFLLLIFRYLATNDIILLLIYLFI